MLRETAQIIFAFSVIALIYVYVGYPLLVYIFSVLRPLKIKKSDFLPTVTVLITAYNEEQDICAKLENTLLIDYPQDKLEILVASDCSNDRTEEIVTGFSERGVKLHCQKKRLGKTMAQNAAVEKCSGEIILFSDATTMYEKNVLREMLPNFADETIGCVAGRLVYVDDSRSNVGKGAKSYWNYETFIKRSESRACSLIGASGCLYAVRKILYQPMYAEACSDFLICTIVYRQGLRSVFEPKAVCTEDTNRQTDKEMRMRVRVISQTFTDLYRNRSMMNPFKSGFFAVEIISHKVLRYAVPFFLLNIFFVSAVLSFSSGFYALIFAIQSTVYLMGLTGLLLERRDKNIGVMAIPLYFLLANTASLLGFYKFLRGENYASWEPIRVDKNADKSAAAYNQIA